MAATRVDILISLIDELADCEHHISVLTGSMDRTIAHARAVLDNGGARLGAGKIVPRWVIQADMGPS